MLRPQNLSMKGGVARFTHVVEEPLMATSRHPGDLQSLEAVAPPTEQDFNYAELQQDEEQDWWKDIIKNS